MMRWILFSVAIVAVAALGTVGSTYLAGEDVSESRAPAVHAKDKPTGPTGLAVIEGPNVHNFGVMAQKTEGKHEWTVVNKGSGPLTLEWGGVTCSCTNGSILQGKPVTLEPGGTFPMVVSWNTKEWTKFHQIATVLVRNDPEHPTLEFVVDGDVKPPVVSFPHESRLDFQAVTNDAPHPHHLALASFDRPDLKVTAAKVNPAMFKTEIVPLTADECEQLKVPKGNKVIVSIVPSAPIGPFEEEMIVATDHPSRPEMRFTLAGKVEGPIRLTPERVRLFAIPAKEGGEQVLTLWVRGRKDTKFTVERKPKGVDVEIAPIGEAGAASQYRFTVKVPAGLPSGSHVEDAIILKTDHPQAAEVKIPVTYFVRAS